MKEIERIEKMKIMMMAGGMKGKREECPHGDIGGFESRRGRSEVIHMSDASKTSGNIKVVAGSGEPATQDEENASMEMVKRKLEKYGYDAEGMTEEHAISIFNEILKEEEKGYWLCLKCGDFHPRDWTRCDHPSALYEQSRDITEEEIDELYGEFDPSRYEDDPYYLQFEHTRLSQWLRKAERVYQIKKGLKTFDIHNSPNSPAREHRMTDEERECWLEEIRAFRQEKQYRHKRVWKDTTPSYRLLHPGNCTLTPRIRVLTVNNNGNEKIIERIEYVRA